MENLIPAFIHEKHRQGKRQGSFFAYVLFLDIAGFTTITERLMDHGSEGAEVLTGIINDIYEPVIRRIYAGGGFVATFAGDAFTAVYPADAETSPLGASWEIEVLFQQKGGINTPLGSFDIRIKQGLAYGRVDWGLVGQESLSYYFRGPAVDQSAELQEFASPGEIIVYDDAVARLAESSVVFETVAEGVCRLVKADLTPVPAEPVWQGLSLSEMEPFLPPALLEGAPNAEFRDVISVFVSFVGMDEHESLEEFARFVLPLSQKYGGYFNGFDFGDKGGKVLIQFGLPVAYEDSLSRALGFAWEVVQHWSSQVKIGVSQGRGYAGPLGSQLRATYTGMGDAVNLAARIMVKAPWGEVWLSENIAHFGEQEFTMSECGEFAFKGKSAKMSIFSLLGPRERVFAQELEGFVDRSEELQRIKDFVGHRPLESFLSVVGENGVGKSRLISQVAGGLGEYEVVFLPANSLTGKSYYPFIYFLHRYFGQSLDKVDPKSDPKSDPYESFERELAHFLDGIELSPGENFEETLESLRRRSSLLAALLGLTREGSLYERLDAQGRSDNTVQALRDFFILLAKSKRVILFFEDFHAVDTASLQVLAELLPLTQGHNLPLVLAGREMPNSWQEFVGENTGIELYLSALSEEDLSQLVDQLLPGPADKKLHRLIYERTQGIPFFAEQLVSYLQEQESLATDEHERWRLVQDPQDLPSGINSILVSRVDQLSPPAKKLIQTSSLLGLIVDRNILTDLDGLAEVTEAHYQEAQNKGIWQLEKDEYRFASDMMRQAAYSMQLRETLRQRHRQIGEQMEQLYIGNKNIYADLAHHFDEGGDEEKSLYYYNLAARTAMDEYRNQEARELFDKLLRLPMPHERYIETALRYVDILEVLGEWGRALDWVENLEQKDLDFYQRNFLGKKKAEIWQKQGDYEQAGIKIDEVIQDLTATGIEQEQNQIGQAQATQGDSAFFEGFFDENQGNREELLRLLAQSYQISGRVFWSQAKYDDSISAYGHSLALSGRLLDRQGEALSLYFMGINYRDKGDFVSAQSYYERALEIFNEIQEKRFQTYPMYDLAYLYQVQGELEAAEERFNQVLSIYEEIGYRSGLAAALLNLGVTQARKGDFDQALASQKESLRMVELMGEKMAVAYTLFAMGVTYFQQREYVVSISYLRDSFKIMEEIQSRGYYGFVYSYLGYVYSLMGKINLTLKTALRNLIHIRRTGTDVEQGLVYISVGLVINRLIREKKAGKTPRPLLQERLNKICRLTGLPCEPEPFLAEAVRQSEKNSYLTTYMPALREYARYLFYQEEWQKGKKYWNMAYSIACDKGLQLEQGRLERLQRKFALADDS